MRELTLFCVVDGENTSFSIKIPSDAIVDDLKDAIKTKKSPEFDDIAADKLTLWKVCIRSTNDDATPILLDTVSSDGKENLDPLADLSDVFKKEPPKETIHIIVQRPPASKRQIEDAEGPSKRIKLGIWGAIDALGLRDEVAKDGFASLEPDKKVLVLEKLGREVGPESEYVSLQTAAQTFQPLNTAIDSISVQSDTSFPVVGAEDLFIREAYRDLAAEIEKKSAKGQQQLIVTGTSGIGKSVFLVYFAIRLLAAATNGPPIVIFHGKRPTDSSCVAFGGLSVIREGEIQDFEDFLDLPETWYLVDSAENPMLADARTIFALSPKLLYSSHSYKEIEKRVPEYYYLAPWTLEELQRCRNCVKRFQRVPEDLVQEVYSEVGGVPRYVLEMPMKVLPQEGVPSSEECQRARDRGCTRVKDAIKNIKDPVALMQCRSQDKDVLELSDHLLHHWPSEDHGSFRLAWASNSILEEVNKLLVDSTCTEMLKTLIRDPTGSSSGVIFEAYIRYIFRKGGTFPIKNLEDASATTLEIPTGLSTVLFGDIPAKPASGTLLVPKAKNFACVDLLLAPNVLFQVTVSQEHPIKGPPFTKLLEKLVEKHWVSSPGEVQLIFVVPGHVYDSFQKQDYQTGDKEKVYKKVPKDIQQVKQYALKIDLVSAAGGGSPGLPSN